MDLALHLDLIRIFAVKAGPTISLRGASVYDVFRFEPPCAPAGLPSSAKKRQERDLDLFAQLMLLYFSLRDFFRSELASVSI